MTTAPKTLFSLAVCVPLLLGFFGVEYARQKWPFTAKAGAAERKTMGPHAAHDHTHHLPADTGATPSGYSPVTLQPEQAAVLQLTTALVDEREFTRTLRTVGTVVVDETRTAHVHVKVRGWINDIFVNFVGRKVGAGNPLCAIYSQDVYSAELEYLSVLERGANRPTLDPLLEAARRRLALWDVPRREVARLERTRVASQNFPLLAPRAGTVVAKEALQGMYVDPSVELYTLSDLSRVWVLGDVYETDVPYIKVGDKAQLAIEGLKAPVQATLSFLYPTIDEPSRTRKVRFVLENPNGRLLPGAFVTVVMDAPIGRGLSVPESAVIRTGTRAIVFVVHGERPIHLEPHEIMLGPLVGDRYRVDQGLSAGDRVATGAQFLIDSESRLRATSAPGGGHVH